jgi:hypothetical protein
MPISSRIQTGDTEPIVVLIVDSVGAPLAGLTDIVVRIRRISDGFYYDWSDDTFKTFGSVVTQDQAMSEVSAGASPGEYQLSTVGHVGGFNTSTISNPSPNDTYIVTARQDTGITAANVPLIGEIKVGDFVDDIVPEQTPVVW